MKFKNTIKIKTLILAIVILASVLIIPQARLTAATVSDTVVTLKEVEEYAEKQIEFIAESASISKWKGCSISKETALFDADNNINAYYLELKKNGKGCGYVIVSAEDSSNILEYSYNGGDSFLTEAKETISEEYEINIKKQKIYYLGAMSYAIGGTDSDGSKRYIDISTGDVNEISKSTMENISDMNNGETYSQSSPPDTKGADFITNPGKYEDGYDAKKSKNVTNWNLNYKVMSELSDGGVCAPTAATNFMYYWYNRGNKYKKLLSNSWKNTFNYLYYYMGTTMKDGTKDSMLATGYSKYLSQKGFGYTVTYHKGTDSGRDLIKDIDKDRPCHLVVHNHYKYKDHSVLAVGYQQYIYKHWYGNSYETYIRIADGWTSRASRFVWGGCKGNWNYVSINIK